MRAISLVFVALCFFVSRAAADCVNVVLADKWTHIDQHSILLHQSGQPLTIVRFQYCTVYSSSDVKIIDQNLCVGTNAFMVDGAICQISALEKSASLQQRSPSMGGSSNAACEGAIRRMEMFCGPNGPRGFLNGMRCSEATNDVKSVCR